MRLTTFSTLYLLAAVVAASMKQLNNATSPVPRDIQLFRRCSGTCEECFGAGNVQCIGLTCYNPSAGESCCSNGYYCSAGQVCADIEGNCCNTGQSIEDCAASLGVPVPTPTPTTSDAAAPTSTQASSDGGSSSSSSSSETARDWVSHHKGIIIGAATGLFVLLLAACCFGVYRRRRRVQVHYTVAQEAPPVSYVHYQVKNPGQY